MSVSNILGLYIQATLEDLEQGMSWYPRAKSYCLYLSQQYNVPITKTAAVVALLSPRNKWERNKTDAKALFEAYVNNEDLHQVKVATFNRNRSKAVAVIEGSEPTCFFGPKTRAFYKNILGSADSVTVDTHAYSVAMGKRQVGKSITRPLYRKIERDYKEASSLLGIKPYELQACTWVTFKRINKV